MYTRVFSRALPLLLPASAALAAAGVAHASAHAQPKHAAAASAPVSTAIAVPRASSASSKSSPYRTPTWYPERKFRVGVLGATGAVGQRFIQYLDNHPWFEVVALGASERSEGKEYGKVVNWQVTTNVPDFVKTHKVLGCTPAAFGDVDFVFSALDANVAGEVEAAFCAAGVPVFSNAKNYRMVPNVPLVVPMVNGGHLALATMQPSYKTNGGFIVTNANCSTTGMVIALKPLYDAFGIEAVHATTMQAISGAGYPGLPSLDILDNVVPYISGEEEKLETEYKKIMGGYGSGEATVSPAAFPLSAMVHRVHVRDGHSVALSIKLKSKASLEQIQAALRSYVPSEPELSSLPSAPDVLIEVREEHNRPQPRIDRDTGRGYTTVVGRIRPDPIYDVKMFVLSHNTVMGAAGSSILNAELAAVKGILKLKA